MDVEHRTALNCLALTGSALQGGRQIFGVVGRLAFTAVYPSADAVRPTVYIVTSGDVADPTTVTCCTTALVRRCYVSIDTRWPTERYLDFTSVAVRTTPAVVAFTHTRLNTHSVHTT